MVRDRVWPGSRFVLACVLFVTTACSGGGGSTSPGISGCADGSQALCVTRCNLGCGNQRCGLTDIAVNQRLEFAFNFEIDAASVNTNTFRMRDASGNEPIGTFFVQGAVVSFIPQAELVNDEVFFGFVSNAVYQLEIPGGRDAYQTLKSTSGDRLESSFRCRLRVSQGIVDFDGRGPKASMLVPGIATCVPRETSVLLEFSEIVDPLTLRESSGGVVFRIASRRSPGRCGSEWSIIPGSRSINVDVTTGRTRLVFRPSVELPGDACVEVRVSDIVRDIASTRAEPTTYRFETCTAARTRRVVVEDFANSERADTLRGSGTWSKDSFVPIALGGSGRLGDFDHRLIAKATNVVDAGGRAIFEIDTDRVVVPPLLTVSNEEEVVTNGILEFTSFRVPDDVRLRFLGSKVPVLRVAGSVQIEGIVELPTETATVLKGADGRPPVIGQNGFAGAIGGGRGGRGGDSPLRPNAISIHGVDGQDVVMPKGHPLEDRAPGTGGRGSRAHPASGDPKEVAFTGYGAYSQMTAAGGSGGGFTTAGASGRCLDNGNMAPEARPTPKDFGPGSAASASMGVASFRALSGPSALVYLVGGAGGGGSGTHSASQVTPFANEPLQWSPGSGGAGGGGILHMVIGGDLFVALKGSLLLRGGDGQRFDCDLYNFTNPAPGGAGSGGSLLVQLGGFVDIRGRIDATGGNGGRYASLNFPLSVDSISGAGGDGLVRIESDPPPLLAQLLGVRPPLRPDNIGTLAMDDEERRSVAVTKFYDTEQWYAPEFVRYELDATIDDMPITFSDDASVGRIAGDGEVIELFVQGVKIDPYTKEPEAGTESVWHAHTIANLGSSRSTAFRVMLRFDLRSGRRVVVRQMRFYFDA
ncbi:MAG: hypothetical protein KDC95_00020 [Planctomycetes bacterium]|nr:hypothetical protein [Planctomycetota bacterium]